MNYNYLKNMKLINSYFNNFKKIRLILRNFFKKQSTSKNIYIYGGGHFSVIFIHIFKLDKYITNIIDDNPNKKNMLLPGTKLRIIDSQILKSTDHSLCFLAFHPDNANKIIKKNINFIKNGNKFLSIFPKSKNIINYLT